MLQTAFRTLAWKPVARTILLEGVLVALTGALFSFAANEISPRGLALSRDYSPGTARLPPPADTNSGVLQGAVGTNTNAVATDTFLAAKLQAKGLELVNSNQVAQLFSDPRYEQELIVFIDARDDRHYQEGHIPVACQFDHYRAVNYLATVLPVCWSAEQIVVYCTGGDCEDIEFTALTLREVGIPKEKLVVYGGGMTEWATNGLPVEVGGRKSGNFRHTKP